MIKIEIESSLGETVQALRDLIGDLEGGGIDLAEAHIQKLYSYDGEQDEIGILEIEP